MNQNPLSGARETLIHRLSAQLRQRGTAPETEGRVEALLGGGFWERFAPRLDGTRV